MAAARRELTPEVVWDHVHELPGGLPVLFGLTGVRQAAANENVWPAIATALAGLDADVVVDAGRLLPQFAGGVGSHPGGSRRVGRAVRVDARGNRPPPDALPGLVAERRGRRLLVVPTGSFGFSADDIASTLEVDVGPTMPDDRGAAAALANQRRMRRLEKAPLLMWAAAMIAELGIDDPLSGAPTDRRDPRHLSGLPCSPSLRPDAESGSVSSSDHSAERRGRGGDGDHVGGSPVNDQESRELEHYAAAHVADGIVHYGAAGMSEGERRSFVEKLAREAIDEAARTMVQGALPTPSAEEEEQIVRRLVATQLGLGRLQLLLDEDDIENININGFDTVWVKRADGAKERVDAIADSDEDLVELVQRAARAHHTGGERRIDSAKPIVDLHLAGGHRLSAMIEVSNRPCVSIRRHRLVDATLDDLSDSLTDELAASCAPRWRPG